MKFYVSKEIIKISYSLLSRWVWDKNTKKVKEEFGDFIKVNDNDGFYTIKEHLLPVLASMYMKQKYGWESCFIDIEEDGDTIVCSRYNQIRQGTSFNNEELQLILSALEEKISQDEHTSEFDPQQEVDDMMIKYQELFNKVRSMKQ